MNGHVARLLKDSGIPATVLRPWYVVGPGHWWPIALRPFYAAAERLSKTRETAQRLGLVTIDQMIDALAAAIANPPEGAWRVWTVPAIRSAGLESQIVVS